MFVFQEIKKSSDIRDVAGFAATVNGYKPFVIEKFSILVVCGSLGYAPGYLYHKIKIESASAHMLSKSQQVFLFCP